MLESKQSYQQIVNLTKGKYELKFEYAPIRNTAADLTSFSVYFNGMQVANIRPFLPGVTTVVLTLNGRNGPNSLEFVDVGGGSLLLDNVGVHPWKTNDICFKKVYAVRTGYPVTTISYYHKNYQNYQLDAGSPGMAYAWVPVNYRTKG